MEMLMINSIAELESLPLNKWGIREPLSPEGRKNCLDKQIGGLDLIVVPGLAFDAHGFRMGYGKGLLTNLY
ncbi:hypothetical protein BB561_000716 [Smittium simulii]|uniref:5-formyltetrahydrofolate cyclo-ligase n=1 Tax=Smittium simulii TaxID=133385 RepID=A0A2T9YXW0_9FUNG|nr:hypothetical protein BB561_000716 [Smittium simulii]